MKRRTPIVLVTDPDYKNALTACRSLSSEGFGVVPFGSRFSASAASKTTFSTFPYSRKKDAFRDRIIEATTETGAIGLLPVGARSVLELDANRVELSKHIGFALPPSDSLKTAADKVALTQVAQELGLDTPRTKLFTNFAELKAEIYGFGLPLILKSSSELGELKTVYFRDTNQLDSLLDSKDFAQVFLSGPVMAQELVYGKGQGFFALYQEGKLKRVMMHERIREHPKTGGSSWVAKSIYSRSLFESGKLLLDELNWHGPAMVEFKWDFSNQRLNLIEVNPKLWGSLDLSLASGVDFPSDTVRVALGQDLTEDFSYEPEVYFYWPLDCLDSVLGASRLLDRKFRTNLRLSDPLPHLVRLAKLLTFPLLGGLKKSLAYRLFSWFRTYGFIGAVERFLGEIIGLPSKSACEFAPNLWLGARPSLLGMAVLRVRGFTDVVSLIQRDELRHPNLGLVSHKLGIDEFSYIKASEMSDFVQYLSQLLESGSKVYLHCREGVGRAPTLVAALQISRGSNAEESVRQVHFKRRVSNINSQQLLALRDYEAFIGRRGDLAG